MERSEQFVKWHTQAVDAEAPMTEEQEADIKAAMQEAQQNSGRSGNTGSSTGNTEE